MKARVVLVLMLAGCVNPSEGADYTAVVLPASGAQLYKDAQGLTQLSVFADLAPNRSAELQALSRHRSQRPEVSNGYLIFAAPSQDSHTWSPTAFSTTMIWRPHVEVGIYGTAARSAKGTEFALGDLNASATSDNIDALRAHACADLSLQLYVDHNGIPLLSKIIVLGKGDSGPACLAPS